MQNKFRGNFKRGTCFWRWNLYYLYSNFFMQLYTLHIYKNNFYIPLIYCFLRNKRTSSYLIVWDMIEKLYVQLTNKPLRINIFHINFEKVAHNAVLKKFPNCVLVYCNFHLGQSWYRPIQQNKLILKEYLNKSSKIGTWLKCSDCIK